MTNHLRNRKQSPVPRGEGETTQVTFLFDRDLEYSVKIKRNMNFGIFWKDRKN